MIQPISLDREDTSVVLNDKTALPHEDRTRRRDCELWRFAYGPMKGEIAALSRYARSDDPDLGTSSHWAVLSADGAEHRGLWRTYEAMLHGVMAEAYIVLARRLDR